MHCETSTYLEQIGKGEGDLGHKGKRIGQYAYRVYGRVMVGMRTG